MTASSLATGRIVAGVNDSHRTDRVRQALPPLIYCHGGANDASEMLGGNGLPSMRLLVDALADAGWPCVSVAIPGTWGNGTIGSGTTTCLARMGLAIAYARTNLGAHATAPPIVVGSSHGAACALTYAYNAAVTAVVGTIPAIDMQAIRVADTLGQRAAIDTAWGVTYPAALPAGANPAVHTAELATTPIQLWYSTDDTVSANINTFATATGADLRSLGALGHTDTAIGAVPAHAIVTFLNGVS